MHKWKHRLDFAKIVIIIIEIASIDVSPAVFGIRSNIRLNSYGIEIFLSPKNQLSLLEGFLIILESLVKADCYA
jgi:hypothetical protein